MVSKLSQAEFLNNVFIEAVHREEQRVVRYDHLAGITGDKKLEAMFNDFARISRAHLDQIKAVANNLNMQV